jgi:hypothetical protein
MVKYKELRKILNSANMSVKHYQNGKTAVTDSSCFRGMNTSLLEEAQELVEQAVKDDTETFARKANIQLDSLQTVTKRAEANIGIIMDCLQSKTPMTAKEIREKASSPRGIRDSIFNGRWNINNPADPATANLSIPNIYISPWQANSLYSQKGLFETIINKKSKSILLNGCYIENSHLKQAQMNEVNEKAETKHNFKNILADSTLTSLVYGGGLTFPLFKKDTPVTTAMNLTQLLKLGVLGKNSIDYFVQLDRWNTFIIPPYNPTQKDFLRPDVYTIPFLGSDVYHNRCARVVTAKQAGYWGQVLNQGWGLSDLCGYVQSGMNYKVAIQSLPLMIQQMSILARVVNVDGVLATEGANALDALVDTETIRTREASPDNPVTMDVLGDIKSINRNFAQVPELIRLLRQDVASDATLPEPLLWSSEKGNFSSGDDTQGNLFKQNESIQMIHKDIEPQFKQLAKIMIIDALGTDKEVIEALPYTQIHFDQPVIANALERAQIGKFHSENIFNLVSSRIPADIAVEMADKNVSVDMRTSADILEKLRKLQNKFDKQDDERTDLDLEQKEADIAQTEAQTKATKEQVAMQKTVVANGGATSGAKKHGSSEEDKLTRGKSPAEEQREKAESDKTKTNYSRLEQKQHEKTRGSSKRSEKLAKSKNKSV